MEGCKYFWEILTNISINRTAFERNEKLCIYKKREYETIQLIVIYNAKTMTMLINEENDWR